MHENHYNNIVLNQYLIWLLSCYEMLVLNFFTAEAGIVVDLFLNYNEK